MGHSRGYGSLAACLIGFFLLGCTVRKKVFTFFRFQLDFCTMYYLCLVDLSSSLVHTGSLLSCPVLDYIEDRSVPFKIDDKIGKETKFKTLPSLAAPVHFLLSLARWSEFNEFIAWMEKMAD